MQGVEALFSNILVPTQKKILNSMLNVEVPVMLNRSRTMKRRFDVENSEEEETE